MTPTDLKRKFLNSLKRGTGEAYIILRDNPAVDFSDLIIKGAITNYSYDNQSEGSRANYIYRLIQKSKQKQKIVTAVLNQLQLGIADYYGLEQMCDLAVKFHKAGFKEAKTAIYKCFITNASDRTGICAQRQLVSVDGFNGVLQIAETIGRMLCENPKDYEDSWVIDCFQKKNKSIDVYVELKKASASNKYIKAFYNSIRENKWKLPRYRKVEKITYEFVKEKIENKGYGYLSSPRNIELTEIEVQKLASEFLSEKNNQKKEKYLRFFSSRKFPFDYKPLFQIAKGKNPKKTRIVEFAVGSLKYFTAKEIRQLALEKLSSVKNPYRYLNLLVDNYKKGDYKLLTEIANRSNNYGFIHSIAQGFIDVYEANPTKECREPLETIYNKMNCGLHRIDILRILQNNNVLSDKIWAELQFDSYDEVRKFYRQNKDRR
ncbi:hypothetical protein SDC9_77950 [bioreactor metagenome]|uniref:Uncharacterized protein n=1 Tax=bioreactor metagenome TaxID=1076179 RepID=A0A644YS32_9ZZZZ